MLRVAQRHLVTYAKMLKLYFYHPTQHLCCSRWIRGVIATFKAYYLRKTFAQAIEKTTGENAMNLTEFWKNFNIKNAVENINDAWREVTASNMRAVWKNIIPHCANDFAGFEAEVTGAVTEIMQLGLEMGMADMDDGNVREFLDSHNGDLNDDELLDLEQERAYDDEGNDELEEMTKTKEFTIKEFDSIFRTFEDGKQMIMDADPNVERAMQVRRQIENALSCYRVMYKEK